MTSKLWLRREKRAVSSSKCFSREETLIWNKDKDLELKGILTKSSALYYLQFMRAILSS